MEKNKVLINYIKDLSVETPNAETYVCQRSYIKLPFKY